jgi:hypothetical protein
MNKSYVKSVKNGKNLYLWLFVFLLVNYFRLKRLGETKSLVFPYSQLYVVK